MKPIRSIFVLMLICLFGSTFNQRIDQKMNQQINRFNRNSESNETSKLQENESQKDVNSNEASDRSSEESLIKLSRDLSRVGAEASKETESLDELSDELDESDKESHRNEKLFDQKLESKEQNKSSSKEILSEDQKSIDNHQETKCENYNFDCDGCLNQENCVYCWLEHECVKQNHVAEYSPPDEKSKKSNKTDHKKTDNQMHQSIGSISKNQTNEFLTETEARRLNRNKILIQQIGTLSKHTCSKRNTLSNISASSCSGKFIFFRIIKF